MLFPLLTVAVSVLRCSALNVQQKWIFPQAPDNTSTLTVVPRTKSSGQSSLSVDFSTYCPDCDITSANLWITTGDLQTGRQIGSGIDVTSNTSYSWTASIPSSASTDNDIWAFRFLPSSASLVSNDGDISSSSFYLVKQEVGSPLAFSRTTSA
ncbi:hypothetical protein BX600DRAFT_474020 [Xylariales sp. PMI_506]|nr:hypothetical protein BX600DRAFT_474020 [Xylariales sp. PMI_506]